MTALEPLTPEQANAVYDVLVEHAGASEDGRDDFVFLQTEEVVNEYRFMGRLGFGGKFWNYHGRWYVTAYPEAIKAHPEMQDRVDATNGALARLREEVAA